MTLASPRRVRPRHLRHTLRRGTWCERLLSDEGLSARIRVGAEDCFDRYLAPEQLGGYYVDSVWRAVSGASPLSMQPQYDTTELVQP